jgi:hypothetical protein
VEKSFGPIREKPVESFCVNSYGLDLLLGQACVYIFVGTVEEARCLIQMADRSQEILNISYTVQPSRDIMLVPVRRVKAASVVH